METEEPTQSGVAEGAGAEGAAGQRHPVRHAGVRGWHFALLALGFLPLLANFGINLWNKPQYQFFPLGLAGAVFLARDRWKIYADRMSPGNLWVAVGLLMVPLMLLAGATALWSPWIAAIGAWWGVWAVAWWIGGWYGLRWILPVQAVLLTMLPPPAQLDTRFSVWLQSVAVWVSSRFLDNLGVIHAVSGNVIELPKRIMLVEEACSGINSILFMTAACVFYLAWRRRSIFKYVACLPFVLAFVLLGNIARITVGGLVDYHYGINLLTGVPHEILGLVLVACYLVMIVSLDHLFSPPTSAAVVAPVEAVPVVPPLGAARSPVFATVAGLLCVVLGLAGGALGVSRWGKGGSLGIANAALFEGLDFQLPPEVGGAKQLADDPSAPSKLEVVGIYSKSWRFRAGTMPITVGIEYPFTGYHPLTDCYITGGWAVTKREFVAATGGDEGKPPREELDITREGLNHAVVLFAICDGRGTWISEPGGAKGTFLRRWGDMAKAQPPTFQIQAMMSSTVPITAAEREALRKAFSEAQQRLSLQVVQQGAARR